ncbi:COG1361 family protein [Streptacidiphilus fuscans]|uniref:Uncharacterized protein n=1 Tax=Streptacidiphilus fuscans TaxID=2789292 RepID=A0A931FI01_9ACTN|nr:hypothetical protein [Streptacidiphilus fuscans]MBF9071254.1 hypothetical protein [Streptacidiphilus fuscans]
MHRTGRSAAPRLLGEVRFWSRSGSSPLRCNSPRRSTVLLLAAALPGLVSLPATAHAEPSPGRATRLGDVHDPALGASPEHCTAPPQVGNGGALALILDWPDRPVTPGTTQVLGVHVTNLGTAPTTGPTQVVVHNFAPNRLSADPDLHPRTTTTDLALSLPADLPPGATASAEVTIGLGPSIPPDTTEHCSVTVTGDGPDDQATAAYDVETGAPVVHLTAAVLPLSARPGQTVPVQAVLGNTGPSNEYTGPAVFTFTAPERTRWAQPYAYRCAPDPATPDHPAGTRLRCRYPGAPLTWRNELEQLPLTVDADAVPGTTLTGGRVDATDPFDPAPFRGGEFDVTVTH